MAITLDHTIVPSHEQDAGARFFAEVFDLDYDGSDHFAPVRVNETMTLLFSDQDSVKGQHYAFVVDEDEFDAIFARIQGSDITYGSAPISPDDGQINTRRGGRGVYFSGGPDPHLWEIMTRAETGA